MAFSATEAAFSGFRLIVGRPLAVLGWSAAAFLLGLVITVGPAVIAGGDFARLSAGNAEALGDIDWRAVGLAYAAMMLAGLIGGAVLYTAIYRAVLRPEQSRFGYLRLGGDELRMIGLFVLLFLILAAAIFLAGLAITVPVGMLAAAAGGGSRSAVGIGVLSVLLILPIMFVLAAWLGVRLSLAGPMTLDTHKIQLSAAWRLTRGHFWPLFGAYALSWVFLIVIWAVTMPVSMGLAAAVSGQGFVEIWTTTSTMAGSVEDIFAPARLVYLLVNSLFMGLTYAIWLAPTADAYRQIRPDADLAETFA